MRKAWSILATISALSLVCLLAGGPCGQTNNLESSHNSVMEARAEAPEEADISIGNSTVPEGTVRFTLVYQSNVNGEYDPCG